MALAVSNENRLHEYENVKDKHLDEQNNDPFESVEITNKIDAVSENSFDDNTCFLCLKPTQLRCKRCLLPYCQKSHYDLHVTEIESQVKGQNQEQYCYPFRVRQRPEGSIIFV